MDKNSEGVMGPGKAAALSDTAGERDVARAGLIGLNNLNYRLEPDMSVAVNCTDKNHFFQQQTYTNTQRAVCVLNSGADYIDPRRSFLCFTIELPIGVNGSYGYECQTCATNGGNAIEPVSNVASGELITFGKPDNNNKFNRMFAGSGINLIDRITISTRSGDELSRIERLNLLQYIINPWTRDKQWTDTIGNAMGMNRSFTMNASANENLQNQANIMRVAIPMYCLSGLFNYDKLLPAMLMSGLRIEIQWAAPTTAFVRSPVYTPTTTLLTNRHAPGAVGQYDFETMYLPAVVRPFTVPARNGENELDNIFAYGNDSNGVEVNNANVISNYQVKDIYFQLKSVQLTDSVQRIMNETSAVNGLEIVYTDFNNSQAITSNLAGDFYMEIRHAASRALRAIMIPRTQLQNDLQIVDSFGTIGLPFKRWHWRLGSLYFPHQPVKAENTILALPQTYAYTADAHGKLAGGPRCAVKFDDYLTPYQNDYVNPSQTVNQHTGLINSSRNDPVFVNHNFIDTAEGAVYLNYFLTNAPISVSLERSTLFNLAGIPINNSRVLSFHGEFENTTVTPGLLTPRYGTLTFDCYLQYVRLARVFLNNVEVEQ